MGAIQSFSRLFVFIVIFNTVFIAVFTTALNSHAESVMGERRRPLKKKELQTRISRVIASEKFTVHEIESEHRLVREYVTLDDETVFAITWQGLTHPDLSVLLGSYHDEVRAAPRRDRFKEGRNARHLVKTENVIVEKHGHMRAARGKAYVPQLLPEGVKPSDLE